MADKDHKPMTFGSLLNEGYIVFSEEGGYEMKGGDTQ